MRRLGIFLALVFLIAGMVNCATPVVDESVEYNLSISSTTGGWVISPGEGVFTYAEGTIVSLSAEAEEGYRFVNWTGDIGTIADADNASTTITMNGDYSITADFEEVPHGQYRLTILIAGGGSVAEPGEGSFSYDAGTVVELLATPASGYRFINWTGDVDTIANVTSASTSIVIAGNYLITANFEERTDAEWFFRGTLDPEGSWEYEWDYDRDVYELSIESSDRAIRNAPMEGEYWGGVSGGSLGTFVHIYHMTEQAGADKRRVIVAAWGNTNVFEAALFPETQENVESIIKPAVSTSMEEVIQHIQAVIELSDDLIRGHTTDYRS